MKFFRRSRAAVLTAAFLGISGIAAGFLLSSLSFRMPSVQIQTTAGDATSTHFRSESTVGQFSAGNSTSANFKVKAGYFRKTKLPEIATTQTLDPTVDSTVSIDLPSGRTTLD